MTELLLRTLGIGLVAVLIEIPPALGIGRWLARRDFRGRSLVESLLVLPMFLPPVAVGFLLLLLLRPGGPFGILGGGLLYTWGAAALAAAVVSFPLLLRHVEEAFRGVPPRLLQVSASLGHGRWRIFWKVELPLARRGLLVGALLSFARGIGEFGATSVLAGTIPGRTETLATGMMRRLASGDDPGALALVLISLGIGFAAVFLGEALLQAGRRS